MCQLELGARGAPKGAPILGRAGRRSPLFPTGPATLSTSARPFGPPPPHPQEQHLHHGRLDCYKSSLIISCVCFTELCPGPLPTPLQGTTLPTHSLGDRGQEKASSVPWTAQGPGECRASSVPHWEGSPPASLSGPGPVQTFMPRPPPFSPAHAGRAPTAWPRLA